MVAWKMFVLLKFELKNAWISFQKRLKGYLLYLLSFKLSFFRAVILRREMYSALNNKMFIIHLFILFISEDWFLQIFPFFFLSFSIWFHLNAWQNWKCVNFEFKLMLFASYVNFRFHWKYCIFVVKKKKRWVMNWTCAQEKCIVKKEKYVWWTATLSSLSNENIQAQFEI